MAGHDSAFEAFMRCSDCAVETRVEFSFFLEPPGEQIVLHGIRCPSCGASHQMTVELSREETQAGFEVHQATSNPPN
jgi:hypothetical protein